MEQSLSNLKGFEQKQSCEKHGEYVATGFKFRPEGKIIWSNCPVCNDIEKQAAEEAKKQEQKAKEAAKLQEMLHRSCLPRRFIGKTFDNFIVDSEPKKLALDVSKKFSDEFHSHATNGTGLIFMGRVGTGKSHLAASIIQKIMPDYLGVYVTVADCIRLVRDTWRRDSETSELQLINRLIYADLLVLDEVGKQYGTEGEQNILFDVLDGRYREKMPTILMGNIEPKEIEQYLGERLADRLRETNKAIPFNWDSYRKRA